MGVVFGQRTANEAASFDLEHRSEAVGVCFVGAHQAKVVRIVSIDVTQPFTQHAGGLMGRRARSGYRQRIVRDVPQYEGMAQLPTVGMRVVAHAAVAGRR